MAEIFSVNKTSPETVPEEGTSSLGNKYTIERTQEDVDTKSDAKSGAVDGKTPFTLAVNWPASRDWTEITGSTRSITAITRYQLYEAKAGNWVFWFTNTEHYDYQFTNVGGETYGCDTWRNGDHSIIMVPDRTPPCIVQVKGD